MRCWQMDYSSSDPVPADVALVPFSNAAASVRLIRNTDVGKKIHSGTTSFEELEAFVMGNANATGYLTAEDVPSGRAEYLDNALARILN